MTEGRLPPGPVLVSACLLGRDCRYDGGNSRHAGPIELAGERRVIPVCPEVLGGLATPRPPAEIHNGDGAAVLAGRARVLDRLGQDVTAAFRLGAEETLRLARESGAKAAILKEQSPSCGAHRIHDGSLGRVVAGRGVTAALLAREGIAVWSEEDLGTLAGNGR